MPSRKQRRRREKNFRHEYGFVTYDEEGHEVEVEAAEVRPEKAKTERAKPKPTGRGGRPLREPPVPISTVTGIALRVAWRCDR